MNASQLVADAQKAIRALDRKRDEKPLEPVSHTTRRGLTLSWSEAQGYTATYQGKTVKPTVYSNRLQFAYAIARALYNGEKKDPD